MKAETEVLLRMIDKTITERKHRQRFELIFAAVAVTSLIGGLIYYLSAVG